jgi:hypothetical protein
MPGAANSRDRSDGELDVLVFDIAMRGHAQRAATGCVCQDAVQINTPWWPIGIVTD